jgi:hypothetical protein
MLAGYCCFGLPPCAASASSMAGPERQRKGLSPPSTVIQRGTAHESPDSSRRRRHRPRLRALRPSAEGQLSAHFAIPETLSAVNQHRP